MDQSKGTAKQTGSAKATRAAAAKTPQQQDPSSSSSATAATPVDDEDQGGKVEDSDSTAADAQSDASSAPDAKAHGGVSVAEMLKVMQAMQAKLVAMEKAQQQQQPQSLSLGASSSSAQASSQQSAAVVDVAALIRAMQESQMAAAEQARKQQATTAAQQLVLRSLGELPLFSGKGADTTLLAQEWLQRAERFFAIREQALGIDAAMGDESRLLNAAYALQDDARRWYDALPEQPSTWPAFRDAVKARFCSVPSERIRVDRLTEFVEKASRLRDKLNVQGMQAFTARFAQLAGEVPDEYLTQHHKFALLARGLPQRYAEVVLQEDAKKPLPAMHEVINTVLSRAAVKQQAASYGGASASSGSPIPINIDAISLAVATFGWTREEAGQHLSDGEGWAPHDTHGGHQGSSSGQGAGAASSGSQPPTITSEQVTQLLAAFAAQSTRVGAGPAARGAHHWSGGLSNAKEVPADLARARQDAGLCIRCGIAKYEPGRDGHHARICQAPADKTTGVEDGIKQAGL
jgi:hypothetical protein